MVTIREGKANINFLIKILGLMLILVITFFIRKQLKNHTASSDSINRTEIAIEKETILIE